MLTIKFPTYIHLVGKKNHNYFLDTLEIDTFYHRENDKEFNFNEIFEPLVFFNFKEQNFKKPVLGEMPKLGPKTEIYHDQGMITKNNVIKNLLPIINSHSFMFDFVYSKKSKDIINTDFYFSDFDELSEYEYTKISFEYFSVLEKMIQLKHPSHLINIFGLEDTKKLYIIQDYLLKNSQRGVYNCLEDLSEHIHNIFNILTTMENSKLISLPYIKGKDIEKFYSSYENSKKITKNKTI